MGLLILQVLKWILWIILGLLIGIVFLAALVLLVPVRYRIEGEYQESSQVLWGRMSWLLSLVQFTFTYGNGGGKKLKLLGITIYDSTRRKKSPKPKRTPKPAPKKKVHITGGQERSSDAEAEGKGGREETESLKPYPIEGETKKETLVMEKAPEEKKKSICEQIKEIREGLVDLLREIKLFWETAQNKLEVINYYWDFWKKETTQSAWHKAKKRIGKGLKSILPRKWLLVGNIGFQDPSLTGQLMACVGILYPIHGGHLQIIPDFEESRLEVRGFAKGKIILGILLYQLLILILDKNCKALIQWILEGAPRDNGEENEDNNMQEVTDDRQ